MIKESEAREEALEILKGAIDVHVHSAPSHFPRNVNDIQAATEALKVGMKAIVIKNHRESTVGRAQIVKEVVKGIEVFGGIVLNYQFGFNPVAVRFAIELGAKIIWMPTIDAKKYLQNPTIEMFRSSLLTDKPGLTIFDEKGEILPEIDEILDIIGKRDVILGTGHLSFKEQVKLIERAREFGVKKILVQHPTIDFLNFSIDEMRELSSMGAYLEHDYVVCTPLVKSPVNPRHFANIIAETDPKHSVLATDGGAKINPKPVEMLSKYLRELYEYSISKREIREMTCDNPSWLLNL